MTIDDFITRINTFRRERDWEQFHKPKDIAISLQLEASEVLEHFQWKSDEEVKAYVKTHKDDIGDELSDVLYWVLLLSHDLKIDLPATFKKKMKKNEKKYPASKARGRHTKYTDL